MIDNIIDKVRSFILGLSKNTVIGVFLAIVCIGYAFFFASPYMFAESADKLLYSEQDRNFNIGEGHTVMIENWQYSKKQQRMELILSFENTTYDGINSYTYRAVYRDKGKKKKAIDTQVYFESTRFAVLVLNEVPDDFSEIAVVVSYDKNKGVSVSPKQNAQEENIASRILYTNNVKVEKVDEIKKENVISLYSEKLQSKLDTKKAEKQEIEEENENYKSLMENITSRAGELKSSEIYMTASEIQEAEKQIEAMQKTYEGHGNSIKRNEEKIQDIDAEIQEIEDKIKELSTIEIPQEK